MGTKDGMKQCRCAYNPSSEHYKPAHKKISHRYWTQKPKEDHKEKDGKSEYMHEFHTVASCHIIDYTEYPSTRKECSSTKHDPQCIL